MTLRARLSTFAGLAIMICGLAVGGTSAVIARQQATATLDRTLNSALGVVRDEPTQNASAVIDYADSSPVPISAELYTEDSETVELVVGRDGGVVLSIPDLTIDQVRAAMSDFMDIDGDLKLRVRALPTGDGEWLVVAATRRDIDSQFTAALAISLALSMVIAFGVALLLAWIISIELRPVSRLMTSATKIADGDLSEDLPVAAGTPEIAGLTSALSSMVDSLKLAVETTSRSENTMREFLGDASHELRTPLTVIRGYIDILGSGQELSDEQRQRAMSRLSSEALRMSNTINDLLLLAELGEVAADLSEEVDLSMIVSEYLADFEMRQPDRSITTNISDRAVLRGNTEHLRRLVLNILSNVGRHTPVSAPLQVSLTFDDSSVRLTVDDGGPGLTEEMYKRTTEGFQRFDRAHSSQGGGFGLGLSIISSIVNNHRGRLTMTPSDLGGLRTTVVLPRGDSDVARG